MAGRCLVVSYYFPPVGGAGVQRVTKLIKYLSRDGWKFTVVTARENSSFQPVDDSQLSELPADIRVIHVDSDLSVSGKTNLKNVSFLKRASYWKRWVGAWISIPDIRKKWIKPAQSVIVNELSRTPYDCIFITLPPYSLGLLASDLQLKTAVPVILDLRDPWSLHPYKIHPTFWHTFRNRTMEFGVIKSVKYGTSAYLKLLQYYAKEIPNFEPARWRFIPNGFDEEDYQDLNRNQEEPGLFQLGYLGTIHSKINSPEILFRIISRIRKKDSSLGNRIRFHHVGKSQIDLNAIACKYGISDHVKLWGYQSHAEALKILNQMDAFLLLHNDKFRNSEYIVAAKAYEYLRLRKPILGLVPENGEAADLIRETDSGIVISPAKEDHIQSVLQDWIRQMPQLGFKGIENYSREEQAKQFLELFSQVTGKRQT